MKAPARLLVLALALAGCRAAPEAANVATNGVAAETGIAFPALTGRVVDQADLLPAADEARLTAALAAVQREVGPQFVVLTVPDLQGREIVDYGVQLGRAWGIGSRERNDGVLLVVAVAERKMRIEVGYGLERRITDPFAARVLREVIKPRFRAGDYAGAIFAGSDAIIERLRSRQSDGEIAAADGVVT